MAGLGSETDFRILDSTGDPGLDQICARYAGELAKIFGVQPALKFYDDGTSKNALAGPSEGSGDGTVWLGVNLLKHELARVTEPLITENWLEVQRLVNTNVKDLPKKELAPEKADVDAARAALTGAGLDKKTEAPLLEVSQDDPLKDLGRIIEYGYKALLVVMAHEYGHILQYRNGLRVDGPWQMEPHADFMAGWFLGRLDQETGDSIIYFAGHGNEKAPDTKVAVVTPAMALETAVTSIFDKGDTEFAEAHHHGQPEFRAAMVRAGYDSAGLDVEAAFAKGRTMANLR
jgi:hypothetical protein